MDQEIVNRLAKEYSHKNIIAREAMPFTLLFMVIHMIIGGYNSFPSFSSILILLIDIAFLISILYSTNYYYVFFILGFLYIVIDLVLGINTIIIPIYNGLFYFIANIHYRLYLLINTWKKKHHFSYEITCLMLERERAEKARVDIINKQIARDERNFSIFLSIFIHHAFHFFIPGMSFILKGLFVNKLFERQQFEEEMVDIYTRKEIYRLKYLLFLVLISSSGFAIIIITSIFAFPNILTGQSSINILKSLLQRI